MLEEGLVAAIRLRFQSVQLSASTGIFFDALVKGKFVSWGAQVGWATVFKWPEMDVSVGMLMYLWVRKSLVHTCCLGSLWYCAHWAARVALFLPGDADPSHYLFHSGWHPLSIVFSWAWVIACLRWVHEIGRQCLGHTHRSTSFWCQDFLWQGWLCTLVVQLDAWFRDSFLHELLIWTMSWREPCITAYSRKFQ